MGVLFAILLTSKAQYGVTISSSTQFFVLLTVGLVKFIPIKFSITWDMQGGSLYYKARGAQ
jgi:hypothetical protein